MYLTQALHRCAAATPHTIATIHGGRERTYSQTLDRVSRLASGLRRVGVREDDRVAILALNSDRYLESLFAIAWTGGVLNPVNTRWSASEIAYSLEDSGSATLIVDDYFAALLPDIRERYPALRTAIHAGDGLTPPGTTSYEALIADNAPTPDIRRNGSELAGVFYTGGTTGLPKGVMLSHANLLSAALGGLGSGNLFRHGTAPRVLHVAPLFHLADFAFFLMTSIAGGTNITLPNFDPETVLATVEANGVTDTLLVPTMLQLLVDHPARSDYDLGSLRGILYGASPIAPALLDRAGAALPEVDLVQAYGMTELSALATLLAPADHAVPQRQSSVGRPSPVSEVRIIDPTDPDTSVPTGTVGEVVVRGPQVMQGYWGKPEETAKALRDGWLHTGDAGYFDADGYLHLVDRLKDMIITGGENVYSAEVENALAQHPSVAACAVIGIPDERWGESVHAVVVLAPGAATGEEELREHARTLIAGYKVPRSVEFRDGLPVSGAGKVLKRSLRAAFHETYSAT